MTASRIKAIVLFVLMACAFGAATAWKPSTHLADQRVKMDLETMFPRSFGEWTVDDRMPVQLVSPDTEALLNKIYNQTLSRTYINKAGERIMLSVAYGGDQSDATRAHRPEVCYPAQGFQVMSSAEGTVSTPTHPLRVRKLVTKLGGRTEPITYWIVVGDKVTVSGTEQKLAQLGYSVRGVIPDGMLVRVSNINTNPAAAYAAHEAFIADLSNAVQPEVRARILGT
jgi:EpsI family protein